MPKAKLIIKNRFEFQDGAIIEIKVWKTLPGKDKLHGHKYSFAYIVNGKRVLGYDNAEGKGDHRHRGNIEEKYEFQGIDKLFDDFQNDVGRIRK